MSELGLVKRLEGEILGPESAFVVLRSQRRREWEPIVESAKNIVIKDAESKEFAVQHGKLLQASVKVLTELYTSTKQQIDAIKKPILEAEKADLGAINSVKEALGVKVQAYSREQERLHQEAVRKAQEEARKADEERKLAEAIAAEAAGEKEEAEHILNEKTMEMPVIIQKAPAKSSGEVAKTTYSALVVDLGALVKAVAAGTVPLLAVKADESWLDKQATAFRDGLNYPGVEVKESTKTHFRT
jgi:hypothetical protein